MAIFGILATFPSCRLRGWAKQGITDSSNMAKTGKNSGFLSVQKVVPEGVKKCQKVVTSRIGPWVPEERNREKCRKSSRFRETVKK